MTMKRRDFLRLLSLGTAATAAGLVVPTLEPVRRYWAVPRNAPVRSQWQEMADEFDALVNGEPLVSGNSGLIRLRDQAVRPQAMYFLTQSGDFWAATPQLTYENLQRAERVRRELFG